MFKDRRLLFILFSQSSVSYLKTDRFLVPCRRVFEDIFLHLDTTTRWSVGVLSDALMPSVVIWSQARIATRSIDGDVAMQ